MSIDLILTTIILLLLGIIFIKALRKIFTIILCLFFLVVIYVTFFTYEGALKFGLFVETNKIAAYKVDFKYNATKGKKSYYSLSQNKENKEFNINTMICHKYGPAIICEKD